MKSLEFACPSCDAGITLPVAQAETHMKCPLCTVEITASVFPAFFREAAPGRPAENVVLSDQSSCFFHPAKKASIVCDNCGRFLCSMCDIELGGRHVCPSCVAAGADTKKEAELQRDNIGYDSIALLVAAVPLFPAFILFTIGTAPLAIFIALWFWNKPLSVLPRSRWRFVAAIMLGAAEIIGWGVAAYFILESRFG